MAYSSMISNDQQPGKGNKPPPEDQKTAALNRRKLPEGLH
jgi:hypothetical protein